MDSGSSFPLNPSPLAAALRTLYTIFGKNLTEVHLEYPYKAAQVSGSAPKQTYFTDEVGTLFKVAKISIMTYVSHLYHKTLNL